MVHGWCLLLRLIFWWSGHAEHCITVPFPFWIGVLITCDRLRHTLHLTACTELWLYYCDGPRQPYTPKQNKNVKMCGCNGMFRCSIYLQMRYLYEQWELTNVIGCFSVRHPVGRAYSREWSSVCTKWLVVTVTTAQWRWDHRPTDPVTTVPATRKSMWTPSPPPG